MNLGSFSPVYCSVGLEGAAGADTPVNVLFLPSPEFQIKFGAVFLSVHTVLCCGKIADFEKVFIDYGKS